jgi:hypothetical protein
LCLVDHGGGELGAEKVDMVISGMWATIDIVGTLLLDPRRRAENDGCAAMLVLSEKPVAGVPELVKGRDVATILAHGHEGLPAHR